MLHLSVTPQTCRLLVQRSLKKSGRLEGLTTLVNLFFIVISGKTVEKKTCLHSLLRSTVHQQSEPWPDLFLSNIGFFILPGTNANLSS